MRRHKKQREQMTPKVCTGFVRELTNSRSISSIPIKSKDGCTLMTEEEQSNIWMEYLEGILNQPDPTNLIDFEQETPSTLFDVTMGNISIEED